MKSMVNRVLICLIVTIPMMVLVSYFEKTLAPILAGIIVFIGLWVVLKPRKSNKETG